MTIGNINGINMYKVTSKEVKANPSYFQQISQTWVEGKRKNSLSEEELEQLKEKFDSSNDQENSSYFSDYNNYLSILGQLQISHQMKGLERIGGTVPEEVKEAWNKAEKEVGMNGMALDSHGKFTSLTKLFVMSLVNKYNGGNGDVLGNTKQSAKLAVQTALEKLGIPENDEEKKEKSFYEAFLRYLN